MAEDQDKIDTVQKPRLENNTRSRDRERSKPTSDTEKPFVITDWASI